MAPQDKKWDDAAERDLCVAIIQGNQDGDRARYNWGKICEIMQGLGYAFTKDAMSQHFTKVIMKDFKNRHSASASAASSSAGATPKKATSASKKRGKAAAFEASYDRGEDDDDGEDEKDSSVGTSAKKAKIEPETPESAIKEETSQFSQNLEHSIAIYSQESDIDAEFSRWMNNFES
ncbi:hypothetical protein PT974_02454 [Cladobotryum mycophilum]|uniref:Myb/SANT-like domain-containing protein n=1 Tax=Cladobotryum mycophilum TaxID=491253 RepID=A0ABR0SYB6_9HYPO